MNDSLRTDIFLRFTPETIACACIDLAARNLQIPLPKTPSWYIIFGAKEEEIRYIMLAILRLYKHKPKQFDDLEKIVNSIRDQIQDERKKLRETSQLNELEQQQQITDSPSGLQRPATSTTVIKTAVHTTTITHQQNDASSVEIHGETTTHTISTTNGGTHVGNDNNIIQLKKHAHEGESSRDSINYRHRRSSSRSSRKRSSRSSQSPVPQKKKKNRSLSRSRSPSPSANRKRKQKEKRHRSRSSNRRKKDKKRRSRSASVSPDDAYTDKHHKSLRTTSVLSTKDTNNSKSHHHHRHHYSSSSTKEKQQPTNGFSTLNNYHKKSSYRN